MKRGLVTLAVTATALTALALSGCTGGGAAGSAGHKNTVKYLIAQPDTPEQLTAIKSDIANFEKKSGVTIKLSVLPGDTVRTVLQTQLRSGNGPDVFQYDTGPGFAGVLAKAGLLYDLTDQYQKRNYPIYDWAKKVVTFDGKVMGLPDQIEEVGLFYNKDLLASHGLQAPTSLDDLDRVSTALKSAGVTPLTLGDKEGWEGGHLLSMSLTSRVGAGAEKALITDKGDWSGRDVVASLDTWKQLSDKGFFPPSPAAITYDNANALFYSGKAAMNPTGTWLVQDISTNSKANIGFEPFPGPDGKGVPTTGLGSGTFMSAKASDPAAALKFMDYLTSKEHGESEISQYLIPAYPVDTSGLSTAPLFKQVLEDTAGYATGSGEVGQNIDVVSSDTFNKAMWDGIQGILSGTATPDQVAKNLQTAAGSK